MVEGLVSTIIPVYNRAVLLREAVASVLAQTYRPIEILIVDDGSTDDTARVADQLAKSYPEEIRVIHQANTGAGLAREAGRQAARGEFIQHLDSDDLLLPQKFEHQVEGLRAHPECGVSYGKTRFYDRGETNVVEAWKRTGEEIPTMFPSFLESRWWGTSTPLYRKQLIDLVGPWTSLRNDEDWEYDCRIASHDVRLHYVRDFVSEERNHDGPRLSAGGSSNPLKLKHRAVAHALMLKHAQRAGIPETTHEMRHFARELFLLSRQCGAAGLSEESKELFSLAREASGEQRGNQWDFKLYERVASLTGWRVLGMLACYSDNLRK
jgi:glycosyltransferase involved in cell wall biosynthesis